MWMEKILGARLNENRAEEAIATGAASVASTYRFRLTMLSDGVKAKTADESVATR